MSRSYWVCRPYMEHILAACTPENRAALLFSMDYGCRIGDVLKMPTSAARKGIYSYKEDKTGKRRRVTMSAAHRTRLLTYAGRVYVFEHRLDPYKHRTRQAVYKDLKRAAVLFRLPHITPHSARKVYSVERYKQTGGNLKKVQRLLNHSDEAVTQLYAMADILSGYHKSIT